MVSPEPGAEPGELGALMLALIAKSGYITKLS